ncbi:hypothetical protein CANTEDRAFT_116289 [Yamadazyma tenuis ATCC 10573]|uniref:Uncharacterized protein n=1 Tax=Candida tenuis (strain ATCC 10573 / BCRC 21748 / CBS 615 / JCM 9827 / NBRC 10315 / NRRL Y-1498 / VKM Y-70) TaxID=590646 RepID=G3BCY3_CANTC|nr:uncharacterized protein CANTEDRAFT_116289 [Yamadazyma tenuis ATCC 10573]EGV60238.1 hypothetical protein CANTEDRAFT_116289 [Yamadazyma tenuis ATCC 10573]
MLDDFYKNAAANISTLIMNAASRMPVSLQTDKMVDLVEPFKLGTLQTIFKSQEMVIFSVIILMLTATLLMYKI